MRDAGVDDIATLVQLMAEFDAESDYVLDRPRARSAFEELLGNPRIGHAWIVEAASAVAGYVVATYVFAMEYGGTIAFVDDFFIRPAFRDRGLGTSTLAAVRDELSATGVRAVMVEVSGDNDRALAVYRRIGLKMTERRLMALPLAPPTHETSSSATR